MCAPGADHAAWVPPVLAWLERHASWVAFSAEEGTTTTPFDMAVLNDLDRFHRVADVIDRVPKLGARTAYAKQAMRDKLLEYTQYITAHGQDLPEVRHWKWGDKGCTMFARCIQGQTASTRGGRTS